MRCNVLGWVLGLPAIALIWGLSVKGERDSIISDLETRARTALEHSDLNWARPRFNVTEATLTGAAYSEEERRQAVAAVKAVWGVWDVADRTTLVEEAPNYVWGAAVEAEKLLLTGFVPNEGARRAILTVARKSFPRHAVHDSMRPARGAPGHELWIEGISFGLRQLGHLKHGGRVGLQGTNLEIRGEAETAIAYRTIKGDVGRRLPSGIVLARDEVTPPRVAPFTWSATYQANQVEFSGHVPPGKVRNRLTELAKESFPKAAIVDKMTEAAGAPAEWLAAVTTALRGIAQLESARVEMSDARIALNGVAVKEVTSEHVATALKVGTPEGFELSHKISFREPTLPTVSPFTTTITTDSERLSLSGYAPDARSRQRLVDAAKSRFPKQQIVDALTFANGAPAGWLTCANAGVVGLAQLDKGRAELSDAMLKMSGQTRDEKVVAAIAAEVRSVANRACRDSIDIKVMTPPEPMLKWQAVSIDKRLEFNGEVINSDVGAALVKDAMRLFPGFEIVDKVRVTPAASAKWEKVVRLGLEQLAKLRNGIVRLDGLVLSLDGVAADTAVATQVKARIERAIAPGYSGQAKLEVKSDAMIWSEQEAQRKGAVAAEETARQQRETAERLRALEAVQKRAAEEAAKARAAAEADRQRELARQRKAAELEAGQRQRARAESQRRRAAEMMARRQAEAELQRLATARAAAERCKQDLNETVRTGTVLYETGSNRLTGSSTQTLDKLIDTYRLCPGAELEISGHTDSIGSEAVNLKLSQRRAEAVIEYFVAKGLPRDKFIAKGYGASRPLASNDTAADRQRNRRIEFDVIGN